MCILNKLSERIFSTTTYTTMVVRSAVTGPNSSQILITEVSIVTRINKFVLCSSINTELKRYIKDDIFYVFKTLQVNQFS